jgi:hypothetical protein
VPIETAACAPRRAGFFGRLGLCALAVAVFGACAPIGILAQTAPVAMASDPGLPDAPGVTASAHAHTGDVSGVISGTVMDTNGDVIQGARVALDNRSGAAERVQESGSNGQFQFSGLPAGSFGLTVTRAGMGAVALPNIRLHAGDVRILPEVVLPVVAALTSVTVSGNPEVLAQEQVQVALQQRVLGVFPNFYTTYDWHAPPMGPRQKFQLAFRAVTDPMAFLGAGMLAGVEQANNAFPGYGQGMAGYSRRYGAAYVNDFSGRMLGSAVFPAIFHQDPRYFYRGSGRYSSRAMYAVAASVIARGDTGRWQPNYSHVLGCFAAGGLSNLYYPAGSRGFALTMENGLLEIAGNAGTNLFREFVLKSFTTRASDSSHHKW